MCPDGSVFDAPYDGVEEQGRTALVACDGVELRVSAVAPEIVRLRYVIEGEEPSVRPSYAVTAQASAVDAAIGIRDDVVGLCTAALTVRVSLSRCGVTVITADGTVLSEDPPEGGLVRGGPLGEQARGLIRRVVPDERFYGFGERTGPLDKRGRSMTFWNTDAYEAEHGGFAPDADPLYQSIPFFVGLRGATAYGVLLDNTHRLEMDMGASASDAYVLAAEAGELDQYIFAGPDMRDVIARYAGLTGKPPLPPRWSLGYHQSRWGYFPDTTIAAVAAELRARELPADGLWLDIQHLDGFRSFTWDPVGFADPSGLVSELAGQGFKTVVIVDPAIKVDAAWEIYTSGLAGGHFLGTSEGPYVGEVWPGPAVFPDFSSPEARQWWAGLVPRALDHGVRGLWIDMNEPSDFIGPGGTVPNDLVAAGDGVATTMRELHNVYGLNEALATYEGMRAAAPDRRPFVLSRAGYAGIQRYAAVWTGDAPSTFPVLAGTLPMLLGMGLSGVPFVGSDVGGYSGGATPELFARWLELGSLSPFFRGHVTSGVPSQEPWQFGTEVEDISRQYIGLRYELLPTWYSLMEEATRTGLPLLRPLVLEFQGDPATHALDDQAMIGPWLMAAPVLGEGATSRPVYLPAGRWFELRSGAIYEGPATIEVGLTLGALPMFVREGGIVARGPRGQWSDQLPLDPLFLDLYPAEVASTFSLYEDAGDGFAYEGGAFARTTYQLERTASGAVLRAAREGAHQPPSRPVVMRVRRVDHGASGVTLDGEPLSAFASEEALLGAGEGFFYDAADRSLVVVIADRPSFELAFGFDPTISEPRPPVPMRFVVTVPPGTPTTTPIHLASSANGWAHVPMTWGPGADRASVTVDVPRGEQLFYKYTRGDWGTVEKWPGCEEASNRYELGAAHPVKVDTVWAWADACF